MNPTLKRFLVGGNDVCTSHGAFAAMAVVTYIYMSDKHWTTLDPLSYIGFILTIMASRLITDCNAVGEKVFYTLFLVAICGAAYVEDLLADHNCTFCLVNFPNRAKPFIVPEPGQRNYDVWALFDGGDGDDTPRQCAKCILSVSGFLVKYVNWYPSFIKGLHEDLFASLDDFAQSVSTDRNGRSKKFISSPKIEDPLAMSPTELRELDEWYSDLQTKSAPKNTFARFVKALAADDDDEKHREKIADMMYSFLCFPTSRRTGPKPSEYLFTLKTPLFTGEENLPGDGPMKIEFEKLVAIMRGDMMKQLRPDVCAMLRLVDNALQNDDTVLTLSMTAAKVAPVANETSLQGHDASLLFPGLYVMKVDEDRDPDGSAGGVTEALISVFKRIPMIDDSKYFDTREEYLAFFRWLIEHKVQDEYYFPRWLSRIQGIDEVDALMDDVGDLVATQFRYSGDRQRIFDSTSDSTLADRAFYGAGVKSMTAVVLPGDPSYGFLLNPSYYSTPAEKEFFRNKAMPTELDFLRMVTLAWAEQVEDINLLRNRIVQIDYTLASHWKYRSSFEQNGSILYLDAETRKPIGIWLSCRRRLLLPNSGIIWEHAKYIHRSTEVSVAAMMHVGEYHLGWANRFNNALRQTLPPHHGLRTLMKPFTHGTGKVNWVAYQMLVLEDSVLARADGFTNRGRGHSWGHFLKHSAMGSSFPQLLQSKGLEHTSNLTTTLPYFIQAKRIWDIHREYVENFVHLIYKDDDSALIKDETLQRFWHHLNTLGRHIDPCICDMSSTLFYKEDTWPAFESTRTCAGLLDHSGFRLDDDDNTRRREEWCNRTLPYERSKALYQWLETDCKESTWCKQVAYSVEHLRPNMGLPELSRGVLIDVITRFIFEVTAGHELAADNLPFIVDPAYGGVRRLKEHDESKPLLTDVSTYVYGTVISALTTIRSVPLLSDWSGLLDTWVDNEQDWRRLGDLERADRKKFLKQMHFDYKRKLIHNARDFLNESLQRPENQWSPFLNPAVQAASIAV